MKKFATALLAASALLVFLSGYLSAEEYDLDIEVDLEDILTDDIESGVAENAGSMHQLGFSLYGYLVNFSTINIYTDNFVVNDADVGNALYLRLKGDFDPEESLHFHFEASYTGSTGNQNPLAVIDSYIPGPSDQVDFPYKDFVQSLSLDHLWGSAILGPLDLQFGKMPIAWGTGYVFNPTSRTSASAFLETVSEETPGTIAIAPTLQLSPSLSLQGYLAFQDKNHATIASLSDGKFKNLPFGLKLQAVTGSFDFSTSFFKEVRNIGTAYDRSYFLGADFVGAIWDFGVYGEAALPFPGTGGALSLDYSSYSLLDHLELCAGFDYEIPVLDVVTRVEYYRNGPGARSKSEYNMDLVLGGQAMVQGEDYLFLNLERVFADYLTVSASGFLNLNDLSGIVFPDIVYEIRSNFLISVGAFLFFGKAGTEFEGEYGVPGIDLTEPAIFMRMKLSF